jgi:hypothetical protein
VTAPQEVFRRVGAAGWIVLSGSVPAFGEDFPNLAERLLERMDLSRRALALMTQEGAEPALTGFMEDLGELLGTSAEILSVYQRPLAAVQEAGLIVMASGSPRSWLLALQGTLLAGALLERLEDGAILLLAEAAAAAAGSWTFAEEGEALPNGLGWLPGALILPGMAEAGMLPQARRVLEDEEQSYALGLPKGSAISLGPGGSVEVWGAQSPRVALGTWWRRA